MVEAQLKAHPAASTDLVDSVTVQVERSAATLQLRFQIAGRLAALRIPAAAEPRIAHLLWQHTCCEAFVRIAGEDAYHELNFSPSGEWVDYQFSNYREPCGVGDEALAPGIVVRRSEHTLALAAGIALDRLSARHVEAPLQIGLSAVIEDHSGALSYWSLHHPPGVADFHHPEAFALLLHGA